MKPLVFIGVRLGFFGCDFEIRRLGRAEEFVRGSDRARARHRASNGDASLDGDASIALALAGVGRAARAAQRRVNSSGSLSDHIPTGGHGDGLHWQGAARAWPDDTLKWLQKVVPGFQK
jgi:hypothetical protein